MTVEEIIQQMTEICKKNQVEHLALFGSYAKGTESKYSDLDFIIYGKVDMDRKSINRYRSFCRSLSNLADAKGRDSKDKFILSGTAQMFNLSFDLSWKVMKDFMKKASVYYAEQD